MNTLLLAVLGVLAPLMVAYVVWAAISEYRATPGTALLTAFENSATIMIADLQKLVGGLLVILGTYGDLFTGDAFSKALMAIGLDPKVSGFILAALGFVVEIARRRTL